MDSMVNGVVGYVKNRLPKLSGLKAQAARVEKLEPEIHALSAAPFREEVDRPATVPRRPAQTALSLNERRPDA